MPCLWVVKSCPLRPCSTEATALSEDISLETGPLPQDNQLPGFWHPCVLGRQLPSKRNLVPRHKAVCSLSRQAAHHPLSHSCSSCGTHHVHLLHPQ